MVKPPAGPVVLKAPARWPVCSLAFLPGRVRPLAQQLAAQAASTYLQAPVLRGDTLEATLEVSMADAAQPAEPGPHTVNLRVDRQPRVTRLFAACTCPHWYCWHLLTVLADLAAWPDMARAVMNGRDVTHMLNGLSARRTGVNQGAAVRHALGSWLDVPVVKVPQSVDWVLIPRWVGDVGWDGTPGPNAWPAVGVEAYLAARKTPLKAHELLDAAIPAADRDLLLLCISDPAFSQPVLEARGALASLLLERLHGKAVAAYTKGRPVSWPEFRLAPRLSHRKVPAQWVTAPADPSRQDEDVPQDMQDALVAEWVTPDGSVVCPMTRTLTFPGPVTWVWLLDRDMVAQAAPGVDRALVMRLQRTPVVGCPPGFPQAAAWSALHEAWRGRGVQIPAADRMGAVPQGNRQVWLALDGSPLKVEGRLVAEYDFGAFDLSPATTSVDPRRDLPAENAAVEAVAATGLSHDAALRCWTAEDDDAARMWLEGLEGLKDVKVRLAQGLGQVQTRGPVQLHVHAFMGTGALDVSLLLGVDGVRADMAQVRRALRKKRRFVQLTDGSLAEMQDRVRAVILGTAPSLNPEGKVKVHRGHWAQVRAWLEAADGSTLDAATQAWADAVSHGPATTAPEMPAGLALSLRGYQRNGLAWLQWLTRAGVGGVLADQMGLGKTVQTLAWLQGLLAQQGAGPALVLCPASVVQQWAQEAARFIPATPVLIWHGADRHASAQQIEGPTLVVSTYGVLRQDAQQLAGIHFEALVFDEAQQLKNADAITTRMASQLQATTRLALTGTPVENRPMDLWSIMEQVNPGLLPERNHFVQVLEPQMLKDSTGPAARNLARLVQPFILRRTKAEVLAELPPRQDSQRVVAPSAAQRRMYDAVAALARADVARFMNRKGHDHSRLQILAALTRLRQVACDPRLVDHEADASASSKRAAFLQLVDEVVAGGGRALVFSSFVELLKLWRRDLHERGIAYQWLDGATRNRSQVVQAFQNGTDPLMLVSLKAGGVGLNLTAADTVILCDPWWNPAVEDQAADRAHRIGQQRTVQVYRLITGGTLEERMVAMTARKRNVADDLLNGKAGAVALDLQTVAELLADSDADEAAPLFTG